MLGLSNQEKIEDFANKMTISWASICATRIMRGLIEEYKLSRVKPDENLLKDISE